MVLGALMGVVAGTARADVVDIIDLHNNNSQGIPAPPYGIGTPVTVSGITTTAVGTFTWDYTDVYVQDATAGIMIYQYGAPPYEFAIGDSVTINGTIAQYRGMTEVDMTSYTVHGSGHAVPPAQVRVCDDVEHVFQGDYSEPDEGRLVRLNNVTWTGSWPTFSGGVTLHDESGSCTMYIDGTTGIQDMTPPGGAFDVIGVIKQYDDFTPPYTTNYELLPRSEDDFIVLPGPQFTDGPYETNIQANQVTIHFETDTETFAIVCYGETEVYEYGCIGSETSTVHDVTLRAKPRPPTSSSVRVRVPDLRVRSRASSTSPWTTPTPCTATRWVTRISPDGSSAASTRPTTRSTWPSTASTCRRWPMRSSPPKTAACACGSSTTTAIRIRPR
jgi:hypothetical protein